MSDSFFALSFEEWRSRTKGTFAQWRDLGRQAWDRIRKSAHWHGGAPCGCGQVARTSTGAQN